MDAFVSNPEVQAQIERVAAILRTMQIGQTIAYTQFSASYYVIMRARAEVEKADGIRFGTVRKVGVKRLAAEEVPAIGIAGIRHMHRAGKKTVKRLTNLKGYNDMTPDDRLRVAAQRMIANAVVERTSRSAIKETEDNVRTAGAAIDFGTVLK